MHHIPLSSSASGVPSGAPTRIASVTGGPAAAAAAAAVTGELTAAAAGSSPPVVSHSGGGSFVVGRLRSVSSTLKRGGAAGAGVSADGSCCIKEDDAEARSLYLQVRQAGVWCV
jgi:hypothetical protein